jgi:hypothetical protein
VHNGAFEDRFFVELDRATESSTRRPMCSLSLSG